MIKSSKWSNIIVPGHFGDNSVPNQGNAQNVTTESHDSVMYAGNEGHFGYPNFPDDKNVGGLFNLLSKGEIVSHVNVGSIQRGGLNGAHYTGSMYCSLQGMAGMSPNMWVPTSTQGSDAYNRMMPTKPNFQGLNAAYELREVPDMLRQRMSKNGLKDIGSYFLALQFGWKPLLNDIRNFVRTQGNAQKRLSQLLRDNGKPVRRSVILSDVSTVTYADGQSYGVISPALTTTYYRYVPKFHDTVVNSEKIWANARFRYWLPGGPHDVIWKAKMIAAIFGFQPSPKVVWNAMPWTWLSDWFVNIGTMLENTGPGVADRLAADYFYMMRELSIERLREVNAGFKRYPDNAPIDVVVASTQRTTQKCRVMGDPFGWNTPELNLSGMRLAILGALGLSRLR